MKLLRMLSRYFAMVNDGWDSQGALSYLVMQGYGAYIETEEMSGFLSIKG